MSLNYKDIISDIPIYYINLNRAIDRKTKLEELFLQHEVINYQRIEAIDGNDLDIEYYKENYILPEKISKYEIACTLSHIKAIQTAYDNNLEVVLIIEDDCNFDYLKYKTQTLNELINCDDVDNWETIQLAMTNTRKSFNSIIKELENKHLYKYTDNGATAYMINRKGMEKIININNTNNEMFVSENFIFARLNN